VLNLKSDIAENQVMANCKRLTFICLIILLQFLLKVSATQAYGYSESMPYLKQIVINGDSVISYEGTEKDSSGLDTRLILDHKYNNIKFRMAPPGDFEYQFFLKGFDSKWTPWEKTSSKEYTNLPAGNYTFIARYRQSCMGERELSLLSVRVLPFWYFSGAAIIIYIFTFLMIVLAVYLTMRRSFARKQIVLEEVINRKTEELITERHKRETQLASVLPKRAANDIMVKGRVDKVKYNFVTVLFSDIQGFTKIAEETNPELLIDELDKFFFYFDSVVEKYGIEKIKTIGDAYMCAGGIPEKNRTNPVEVILAALEMQAYMSKLKQGSDLEGMKFWDIRIGIHTGTVVAGVVGQKKLSYDIWGDTVNTASRMESSGEAGKINISGTTYEFIREFFSCEYRGRMPVKYKGELEMYFVNGILPELCDENGGPNRKFIVRMQIIKLQDIEEMVIKMFDDEAPPNLYFHNSSLVRNISTQVDLIANAEKLPEEDYVNLKLAALFLMTGFITDYEKPMEVSIRLAEELLPGFGFTAENLESVDRIIKNSYADNPETLSDYILHDARYDYLGRVDYLRLTDKLLRELTEYGKQVERKKWIEIQKKLLLDNEFKTKTARLLRSVPLADQVEALMASVQ
jgi:adenylate cyclase